MSTGLKKIERRGGYREGAGRKPETLSAHQVKEMLKTAKAYAKEKGKNLDEVLLDIIYDEKSGNRDKLAGIKLWKEYTIAKLQEGGETDQAAGPQIGLPESKPDPGKVVPIKTD